MSNAIEGLEALHRQGEFGEILRSARTHGVRVYSDVDAKLLVAHALAITGDFAAAWELVSEELASPNPRTRSRSEYVGALVCQARGEIESAISHLRAAMAYARKASDWEQLGWAKVSLFRLLSSKQVTHDDSLTLQDVRRVVGLAANPHLTAFLHICVASLEGEGGRYSEALRHCDIADSLLHHAPNRWLSADVHLKRAAIASVQHDYDRAARHIRLGRDLCGEIADLRRRTMFDGSAAHIELETGRFEKARETYRRVLQSPVLSSSTLIGATEGLARLELAVGDLAGCAEALRRIEEHVARDQNLRWQYAARWAHITHARMLLQRREPLAALSKLESTASLYSGVNDGPFLATLKVLWAVAQAELNNPRKAAERILLARTSDVATFRSVQFDFYKACGALTASVPTLRAKFEIRAEWIADSRRTASADHDFRNYPHESIARSDIEAHLCADVIDSIVSIVDLAFDERLLRAELSSLLKRLGFSEVEIATQNRVDALPIGKTTVAMPSDQGRFLVTGATNIDNPTRALMLGNLLRISAAALSLERLHQEERNRAALWPAEPVEVEAGAVFASEEMRELLAMTRRVAAANIPVLITGETGTGKEVLARLVHAYSSRAKGTFMPFNCTATPKEMLDSQLFGHRRGAFTGATDHFPGVIRAAAGGTLFLDEIGETTLDVQPKLLRFLEAAEVHPIGETHPTRVDVRILAATNADLETLVAQGRFREDLYYRLNTVRLHLPPLRERRVEIPLLAAHYLRKYAQENGKGDLRLAEETMEYLVLYRWPGNIRQLANEMRRMAALAEKDAVLMPEHLSTTLAASRRTLPPSDRPLDDTEIVVRLDQPMAAGVAHVERAMILHALKKCGGRLEDTALTLGLSRKGLYLKRQRYGLDPAEDPPDPRGAFASGIIEGV